jgi:hypothetical protein
MFTGLTILQTKSFHVKGVMLELAFAIMRPAMPCWDEELHLLHLEKQLEDRVFPCCNLEGTSNVIH